jgi:hypothetical protein
VSALGGALYSPGGATVGVSGEFDVLGRYGPIGLRLFGSAPLVPNRIRDAIGSADLSTRTAGLQAVWVPSVERHRWFAEVGVGSALVSLFLEGNARDGFAAHDDDLLTVAPIADARLGLRVTDALRLVAGTAVLVPLRSDRVRFAGEVVGRYGQVLVTAGLGIELAVH